MPIHPHFWCPSLAPPEWLDSLDLVDREANGSDEQRIAGDGRDDGTSNAVKVRCGKGAR